MNKLKTLDHHLRRLFASRWVSARKAFLDLDMDRDGYITALDIIGFFGGGSRFIDFNDLAKIIHDISPQQSGKLNYFEFCKWMGSAI